MLISRAVARSAATHVCIGNVQAPVPSDVVLPSRPVRRQYLRAHGLQGQGIILKTSCAVPCLLHVLGMSMGMSVSFLWVCLWLYPWYVYERVYVPRPWHVHCMSVCHACAMSMAMSVSGMSMGMSVACLRACPCHVYGLDQPMCNQGDCDWYV